MMNLMKEQTRQYVHLVDLRANIKDEECREKSLRNDLEKLQREELNDSIDAINCKIKRAEFILVCEKEKHRFYYNIIETAKKDIGKEELFQQFQKYGLDPNDYRGQLEKEKASLRKQLEELKK